MRGWFMGTCGPSTKFLMHVEKCECMTLQKHVWCNEALCEEEKIDLLWTQHLSPPTTPERLSLCSKQASRPVKSCVSTTSGLWQQFKVFPPNITTLFIVIYTNSMLLPFTQLNKYLWWKFLGIRQERGLICKGTHIKEERVVHRKRKLHMSQVSWTVVEVLIAGWTDLADAGHRKTWDTPQLWGSPAWFQGGDSPLCGLLVLEPDHTGCLWPHFQPHRGTWHSWWLSRSVSWTGHDKLQDLPPHIDIRLWDGWKASKQTYGIYSL